ncbi:hypothetical protein WR25_20039 [Diploscapter pachys]|uniref:Uncharacterized protein n=1 Tax=Diploscapter pachys TaxID=2018661 RepID=A0A2A2KGZ2_9BILA|nr:hypothetical protein WR25_20039 [Diploscapter pachys]
MHPTATDLGAKKAYAAGLCGAEHFADHMIGVEEVTGTREEQATQDRRAQLRRRFAHCLCRPQVHGYALCLHAGA